MAGTPQYGVHRDVANTRVALNYAGTRRLSVNSAGVDINGTLTVSGSLDLAAGSIERADLATETVFIDKAYALLTDAGAALAGTDTAGTFNRAVGTNQLFINGEAAVNETELSTGVWEFVLPENYVAGGSISLRAVAGVTVAGDAVLNASSTIDMEARKQTDTTGAIGSDLVTTAATALPAAGATYDFVVTPTGLAAGDKLVCKLATSVIEDAGGTGAATAFITKLGAVIQVKG